jgi:hypothetical protein
MTDNAIDEKEVGSDDSGSSSRRPIHFGLNGFAIALALLATIFRFIFV